MLPGKATALVFLIFPALIILLMNYFWAYILGVFLLPVWFITLTGQPEVAGHIDLRFSDALFIVAALGWFLRSVVRKKAEIKGSHLDISIFLLLSWMLISIIWCPSFSRGIVELLRKLNGVFIFYLTINLVKSRRELNISLTVWIVAGVLASLLVFHQLVTEILGYVGVLTKGTIEVWGGLRTTGLKENANRLGFFLNLSIMLAISRFFVEQKKWFKVLLALFSAIMIAGLISTLSRNSLIGLVFGLFVLFCLMKKGPGVFSLIVVAATIIFLVVVGPDYRDILFKRYIGIINLQEAAGYAGRTELWQQVASRMFAERPLVGIGLGGFITLSRSYGAYSTLIAPHNLYIYLATELGLIGLLLFVYAAFRFLRLIKLRLRNALMDKERFVLAGLIAGIFIYGVQGFALNFVLIEQEFWTFFGLSVAAMRIYCEPEDCEHSLIKGPTGGLSRDEVPAFGSKRAPI